MSFEWAPFSEKQLDGIANSDARINAFDGPVRSGKTTTANVAWTDFIPKAPFKRLLMTGVTKDTLYRNVLADLFDIWGEGNYKYDSSRGIIWAFGKEIHVVGMDNKKAMKKIRGLTIGGWYADEIVEYPFEVVEMALTRMSVKGARAFWTMNPDSPYHPVHKKYLTNPQLLAPQNGRPATLKRWQYQLDDNTSLDPEFVDFLKTTFTGVFYERNILGLWVAAEGVIYGDFKAGTHVITWDQFQQRFGVRQIPANWIKIRCIDFGFTHPFVCQWWAISPDGEWFLYREIYRTRRIVEDHAKDIIQLSAGERYLATYTDHDAEDRATLERHGVPTDQADKAVVPGIQAVQSLLKVDPVLQRPHLYLLQGALVERDPYLVEAKQPTCTEEEFEVYLWVPPEKSAGKTQPVKEFDHGMDPMRYGVHSFTVNRPIGPQKKPRGY